ncbi:MAG: AMP-binding protein, partial [Gammaproteobacteria bacterium]
MPDSDCPHSGLPASWLQRAVGLRGRRPALIVGSERLSYAALADRLGRLAAATAEQGLEPGVPFAVVSARASRVAWALYLALYTASPLWPLDPRREDLRRQLGPAGIEFAFTDEGLGLPTGVRRLPSDLLERVASLGSVPARVARPSDVQLVVATSGSTGEPRAVMLTAANLGAAARASRSRLGLRASDLWLACLPLYHVGGCSIVLRVLEAGAGVLLDDGFEAGRVWSALRTHAVTHLSLVAPMLEALLNHASGRAPPQSLRVVLLGGGPIAEGLVRRAVDAGWPVCPSYGLSENATQVATLCPAPRDWPAGYVGPPVTGVRVEIVDDAGRPTSGIGRIRITGPTVMAGYLNPGWSPGEGLVAGGFNTSDLGYLDGRGHLHVRGRADEVIVSGGENVMPDQVEALLLGCAEVTDVGVLGVPDAVWGQRVAAV